mmetsp:Transcript_19743/g.40039  ORF Transcript_19743/g.40039 Transcript_19743/m.40039 type:complete len:440 (-) Transcript_19743:395-1714(-)|eukprot:CAMPEP_0183312410 /NCGR_PEP_ID=MMETSP0160_2-20130417/41564_1 /TAXON_ID=2839 ORGANISM="Odontella Sinensis, Strain Grunow 1884" /NCGR_SAMPLE_ID=MMETSP0160_2 /ASSEMBLY_ACC=CAM_ASM_000250 /LENGTH=439 /DNA_ID=CAMNT_0025477253 /DNA_START=79 /DNA_END=1398 /DNA_ORIENTATION=+
MFSKIQWKGRNEFLLAQIQIAVILGIAHIGNNWPKSYPRNDNHDPKMFWVICAIFLVAALATIQHEKKERVALLSRAQTEEWKGWMQLAFILYHYYRVYYVYNEIRVFVSAYVWMTGFGNFLYFDKTRDFTLDRMVSMWLRINYFPLLLSYFLNVPIELYYVVPLHTVGFFVTMATCFIAHTLEKNVGMSYWPSRIVAISISLLVHVVFYETSAVDFLLNFSKEIHLRFQIDKYSAWVGILSGLFWKKFTEYSSAQSESPLAQWGQRLVGSFLIAFWWYGFGFMTDKLQYNPKHPYIFFIPIAGWLMIRNSSRYLTQIHAYALEFFGRITLETYVLQFHVFMCQNVQQIPVVIPGSDAEGSLGLKTANMLLCGTLFVALAWWARKVTVSTQTTVTDLVKEIRKAGTHEHANEEAESFVKSEVEMKHLTKVETNSGGEVV